MMMISGQFTVLEVPPTWLRYMPSLRTTVFRRVVECYLPSLSPVTRSPVQPSSQVPMSRSRGGSTAPTYTCPGMGALSQDTCMSVQMSYLVWDDSWTGLHFHPPDGVA